MRWMNLLLAALLVALLAFAAGRLGVAGLLGSSLPPAAPSGPGPTPAIDAGALLPTLEAQIALATSTELLKQGDLAGALESADRAIVLAPEWPEAYRGRVAVHQAVADAQGVGRAAALEGTRWTGVSDGTRIGLRFQPQGRLTCAGDICPTETGRWSRDGGSVTLLYDDGDTVEVGTLEGQRLSGFGYARSGGPRWKFSLGTVDFPAVEPGALRRGEQALDAASLDLETYLRLAPEAPDRANVVLTIAQLKVRAARVREERDRLEARSVAP